MAANWLNIHEPKRSYTNMDKTAWYHEHWDEYVDRKPGELSIVDTLRWREDVTIIDPFRLSGLKPSVKKRIRDDLMEGNPAFSVLFEPPKKQLISNSRYDVIPLPQPKEITDLTLERNTVKNESKLYENIELNNLELLQEEIKKELNSLNDMERKELGEISDSDDESVKSVKSCPNNNHPTTEISTKTYKCNIHVEPLVNDVIISDKEDGEISDGDVCLTDYEDCVDSTNEFVQDVCLTDYEDCVDSTNEFVQDVCLTDYEDCVDSTNDSGICVSDFENDLKELIEKMEKMNLRIGKVKVNKLIDLMSQLVLNKDSLPIDLIEEMKNLNFVANNEKEFSLLATKLSQLAINAKKIIN